MAKYDKTKHVVTQQTNRMEFIVGHIKNKRGLIAKAVVEIKRLKQALKHNGSLTQEEFEKSYTEQRLRKSAPGRLAVLRRYTRMNEQDLIRLKQIYTVKYKELITGETQ